MTFASREDAGRQLAEFLSARRVKPDLVLGLPRGGVIVAAEVARHLRLHLDVLIVRKIGHPWYREFAVGAIAENGAVVLDESRLARDPLPRAELDAVVAEEIKRLQAYLARFQRAVPVDRRDRDVILVDDGLATGATMEVAVKAARQGGARRVVIAVPVASTGAVNRLRELADEILALEVDPDFEAVGRYYQAFEQTTDEEVIAALRENERAAM
jgi:putative phosphoribosyl transferase